MSVALKLYEQLTETADDRERFRFIVDAIGALEEERPQRAAFARTTGLHETELRPGKEIEQVPSETAQVRPEVERVRAEVGAVETRLQQAMHRQTLWIVGAVGTVVGLIRLLDYLLA
jgi:hypothetical protein